MGDLPEDQGETGTVLDYRCLFESAPAQLLVLDRGFRVVAASDAYLDARRISRAEVIGREIFSIAPGADDGDLVAGLRRSLARVLRDGAADAVNVPVLDRGRVIYIIHRPEQIAAPQQAPAPQPPAPPPHLPQPAPRVPMGQQTVEQAQAEFASRVSRELRSPLSTILGFGELLALGDLTEDQRDKAWVLVRAARRLEAVMKDITDISRTEDTELSVTVEPAPAAQAVAGALELIRPLAASHGVHLDPVPNSGLYLYADQQRLRQVLLNLLSNSVKYNHPGGKVTVGITSEPGRLVRITVTDTGRGIAGPDLARLFTPFQRLDAAKAGIEGTGLGLALCQRLVRAMGGQTGVSSTIGLGSAFWVELPAAQPAQTPDAVRTPSTGVRAYPSPKTLLYVEDMVENLRLVEQILKKRPSVRLVPAMLGGVALDLAAEHHPDVILLDLHLPDIAGEELLHRFQADPATSSVPVVILSADAAEAQINRLLAAGAAAYVTKPIGVRSFLETVDRLVGQAAGAPISGPGPATGATGAAGTGTAPIPGAGPPGTGTRPGTGIGPGTTISPASGIGPGATIGPVTGISPASGITGTTDQAGPAGSTPAAMDDRHDAG